MTSIEISSLKDEVAKGIFIYFYGYSILDLMTANS